MSKKPTYEELGESVKKLENDLKMYKENEMHFSQSKMPHLVEIDSIPVGFFRIAPEGSFLIGNHAILDLFGYKAIEEFLNDSIKDLFWDFEDFNTFFKKLTSDIELSAEEVKLKKQNGALMWGAITAKAILDEPHDIKYFYGMITDITERKMAEQRLNIEKRFSETVIESLPGLFFMLDEEYRYVKWNKNAEKIYGYELDEIFSLGVDGVIVPEDIPVIVESFKRAKRGESGYAEYTIRAKDGRKIPLAGDSSYINIDGDNYFVGMEIDISKRKQVEDRLKKALDELKLLKDKLEAENVYLNEQIKYENNFSEIVGKSEELKYVLFKAKQVSSTDSSVLIMGETGVGKGIVAQTIHNLSPFKERSMVKVNCASLSASLIENELFGHEKGAFTGANSPKPGRFEIANGSTIFLDEISELPLELQAKLLRVVEEGEMERLGGTRTIKVKARIISATNKDLEDEVKKGRFREDLWYRLNVFPITVPPLRDRKEDIPLLVEYFVNQLGTRMGKSITTIPQGSMEALLQYSWPGNIRELRNVIERAVISSSGPVLYFIDQFNKMPQVETPKKDIDKSLAEMERDYIINILEKKDWRISGPKGAANILGLKESTLRSRMKKLGIKPRLSLARF